LDNAAKEYVSPILNLLRSEGVIFSTSHGKTVVWHAIPRARARALAMLDSPLNCGDEVVTKINSLK